MKTLLNTCAIVALGAALLGCATDGTDTASITPAAIAPRGAAAPMPANMEAALKQAEGQRRAGDFDAAAHTLAQLVLVAPDDARVLGEYGKVMVAQSKTDDAIAFLQRATQLNDKDWTLFSALGVALDQKGDYKTAQTAYARALAMKPGEPTVLSNAALSHLQQGDVATARRLLQQARTNSNDPKIVKNLAFIDSMEATAPAKPTATATVRPAAQPVKPAATASAAPTKPVTTASAAPAKPAASAAQAPVRSPVAAPAPTTTAGNTAPVKPQVHPQATQAPAVLRRGD